LDGKKSSNETNLSAEAESKELINGVGNGLMPATPGNPTAFKLDTDIKMEELR
jgi:hypothetical protein